MEGKKRTLDPQILLVMLFFLIGGFIINS
jgi:hypothetical protein